MWCQRRVISGRPIGIHCRSAEWRLEGLHRLSTRCSSERRLRHRRRRRVLQALLINGTRCIPTTDKPR